MPKRARPEPEPFRVLSFDPGLRNLGVARCMVRDDKIEILETFGVYDIFEASGSPCENVRKAAADATVLAAIETMNLKHPDWLDTKPDVVVIESQIGKKESAVAAALLSACATHFPGTCCLYMGAMGKFKVVQKPDLSGDKAHRHKILKDAAVEHAQTALEHVPAALEHFQSLGKKMEHVADCLLQAMSVHKTPKVRRYLKARK